MRNCSERWPLHPVPLWEESLSSWLHRLAAAYWMSLDKWFEAVFHEKVPDDYTLDTNPSHVLLTRLSLGTGFSISRLYRMTTRAYMPWIMDGFDKDGINLFSEYFDQSFDLLPWRSCTESECCRNFFPKKVIPWLRKNKRPIICTKCIETDLVPYLRIFWRLAIFGSCPKHKIRLIEYPMNWKKKIIPSREIQEADDDVIYVDKLSLEVVTKGHVLLWPERRLSAAIYCRWLRFLIEDLFCFSHHREDIDCVWHTAEMPYRLGLWGPFYYEALDLKDHYRVLKIIGFILRRLPTMLDADDFVSKLKKPFWFRSYGRRRPIYFFN